MAKWDPTTGGDTWIDPRRLEESYGLGRGSRLKSEGGSLDDATVARYAARLRPARGRDAALRALGFPLFVWLLPGAPPRLQIGDGHHRVRAAIDAGLPLIPIRAERPDA